MSETMQAQDNSTTVTERKERSGHLENSDKIQREINYELFQTHVENTATRRTPLVNNKSSLGYRRLHWLESGQNKSTTRTMCYIFCVNRSFSFKKFDKETKAHCYEVYVRLKVQMPTHKQHVKNKDV